MLIEHQHGGQTFDLIGFGPAQFDILMIAARKKMFVKQPLAFFSDDIVYQRRFTAAAHTTHHNQLPVRDFEADVFQVIRPRVADDDGVHSTKVGRKIYPKSLHTCNHVIIFCTFDVFKRL